MAPKRSYDSECDFEEERPFKMPRPSAALRLSTVNDLASSNRRMEGEVDSLLQELNDAYATIERLRQRISARQMFGSDSEDEDSDKEAEAEEEDTEPWFVDTFPADADQCVVDLTYDSD
ncbi:hypothetical protein JG687_00018587 [Phytophthora cactorum]|uniref:Uncharacterized protein n=1 Tax=Phytophthora cactorum TaxID=29920 RepID=A0A329RR70_9STRA|nr:hypothetical protein Pcac1_g14204 [Phytophthora cactorum]KAG2808511.1 hypothetical protein PC111_g16452 [Phytophthora cactorum]KAG2812091.1 hypothetical protein PC112_g15322 [Phytophthora cactorum]KAG2853021.1 hypothetical protein PC113_g14524 [Phytophthora cactorum]KAG2878828.1 hypothetical protein PC114_g22880 [Phytophthora cactorum]